MKTTFCLVVAIVIFVFGISLGTTTPIPIDQLGADFYEVTAAADNGHGIARAMDGVEYFVRNDTQKKLPPAFLVDKGADGRKIIRPSNGKSYGRVAMK